MIALLRESWSDVAARKEIAAAQFAGNLVLLALLYWWLGLAVSTALRVALVAVAALMLVAGSAWLHGAGFAAFRPLEATGAFSAALRNLLKLCLITAIFTAALLAWDYALGQQQRVANFTASALTFSSQKPVSPESVAWIFPWKLRAWFVLLGLLLMPMAAAAVGTIDRPGKVLRRFSYWIAGILLALFGLYVPWLLIQWIPAAQSLALELASAAARFALAYTLAIASWLVLAALIARLGRQTTGEEQL